MCIFLIYIYLNLKSYRETWIGYRLDLLLYNLNKKKGEKWIGYILLECRNYSNNYI